MAFSPAFLDELKIRVGLVPIVGKRVRLIRRGREHHGLCPFHKEKTPSFTINEDKGFYHCFGCGKHGSVFDFVMETEGLSFPEAVERLAREAGMELPERDPRAQARDDSRGALAPALAAASAFFERTLRMPEGRPALEYLRGRGLTDETIAQFHLGFAPDRRDALKAALIRDGFTEERLIEAGLLIRPEEGATYDRFRGRVIFPIADRQGRTIAFGGRVLGQGEPKYLNSPETPLFHKGSTLYGLPHALGPARTAGEIVVVEGYMDVIGLQQAGIRNAVAPLGTALTEDQIRLLWRIAPEPVLCFDGDTAGERAALRAIERALPMLTPGFSLRFAFIPAGEDPDSFVRRRGADAARKLLGRPLALSETLWLFETAGGTPATPEARADLKKRLLQHAARIQDEDLRRGFNQHFGDRVWREFSAARGAGAGPDFARGPKAAEARIPGRMALGHGVTARIQAERVMLALVVNQPGLFAEIEEELGTARFTETALDRLRQGLLGALGRAPEGWTEASVPELLADAALKSTLAEVLAHPLVKAHRMVRPGASLADARATWAANAAQQACLATEAGADDPKDPEVLTTQAEAWERRQVTLDAPNHSDEAAE